MIEINMKIEICDSGTPTLHCQWFQ